MKLRRLFFWCHLVTGVSAGVVVLIMSLTGVLLVYERQILAWADRSFRSAPPSPGAARLPVDTLLFKLREARPDFSPATLTLRSDPDAPAAVTVTGGSTLLINPYSGQVLGESSPRLRAVFRRITDWHRWLGAGADSRALGRAITGACNLGFLFLVCSGFYLWWPRRWSGSALRGVTWFQRGLGGKARDWNWHNVIGFWSSVPLFLIVLSAVLISYPWATSLLYRATGSTPPEQGRAPVRARAEGRLEPPVVLPDGIDRLWPRAETQVAGWQSITLRLPDSRRAPLAFTIDEGNGGQPQKRSQLLIDAGTGEVVRFETFWSYNLGRRLRTWGRWLHTGEAAGLLGQTIAGVASAGGVFLVWTGLALAWRRLRTWMGARSRSQRGVADAASPTAS